MVPRDGNQSDAILVADKTPSKLPRAEQQALNTSGDRHQLESEQPGSAWLWGEVEEAPSGSKVTVNV